MAAPRGSLEVGAGTSSSFSLRPRYAAFYHSVLPISRAVRSAVRTPTPSRHRYRFEAGHLSRSRLSTFARRGSGIEPAIPFRNLVLLERLALDPMTGAPYFHAEDNGRGKADAQTDRD